MCSRYSLCRERLIVSLLTHTIIINCQEGQV
nr:MAG TPA: hypothetical protein [Caudoviricetes sp.]DAJ30878.1 MAG TPA: hypothetical protein [Caudoviricetes sp.]DAT02276.1 MAG TPA: hypothetical protein [Caudoviricetes sp.]DAT41629.1 MAG TPA: hypothetical protein [Caudoviricetes sp.]